MAADSYGLVRHRGRCHCGAVRFSVLAPPCVEVEDCNCSLCRKCAYLHLLVPAPDFTLEQGGDALACYTFNSRVAQHTFCRHCGVKAFYVPRSNPDGYSINLRCLDPVTLDTVIVNAFDGEHWERHAARLRSRSAPR